jgi:uncharacterized membrane protein
MMRRTFAGLAAVGLALGFLGDTAYATEYTLTTLQSVGVGPDVAAGINASGEIVGSSVGFDVANAVVWSPTGNATVLTGENGNYSEASGINDSGEIVGSSLLVNNMGNDLDIQAVLWSTTRSRPTVLTGLGGNESYANGINASGQIVGFSSPTGSATGHGDATRWDSTGQLTILPGLGGTISLAEAINASGQIVGLSFLPGDAKAEAVMWDSTGHLTVLPGLGGTISGANAINASGESVGFSWTPGDAEHAVEHAVIWTSSGMLTDLSTYLVGLGAGAVATGINDAGDIVGYSYNTAQCCGERSTAEAWLLTPAATGSVPEPASICLVVVATSALFIAGWLRRRATNPRLEHAPYHVTVPEPRARNADCG